MNVTVVQSPGVSRMLNTTVPASPGLEGGQPSLGSLQGTPRSGQDCKPCSGPYARGTQIILDPKTSNPTLSFWLLWCARASAVEAAQAVLKHTAVGPAAAQRETHCEGGGRCVW